MTAVLLTVVLGAGVSLAVVRSLRPESPEGPITLAFALREGESFDFRMTMRMDGVWSLAGQSRDVDMEVTADAAYTVRAVEPDGTMTLDLSVSDAEVRVNGDEMTQPRESHQTTIRVAPDGRIVATGDVVVPDPTGGTGGGMDQMFPLLPDFPIEVGDTWEIDEETPFPLGDGTTHNLGEGRFLRYEEVDGELAAVIQTQTRSTTESTGGTEEIAGLTGDPDVAALEELGIEFRFQETGSMRTITWVDPDEGEVLAAEATGSVSFVSEPVGADPTGGLLSNGFEGDVTFTMERR